MIKLNRPPKPKELTSDMENELIQKFKEKNANVWNQGLIKKALLQMSNNKCCYCECNISEESKYMEVEHFYPKKYYPDLVVNWDNLLPSCKRCNGNKGEHDPNHEEIINPSTTNPKEHLMMKLYRLKGKTNIGDNTIDVLYLNDLERLVLPRFLIGNQVQESLQDVLDKTRDYHAGVLQGTKYRNRIYNALKNLLKLGEANREYSAIVSTVLLNDENFYHCKELFIELGFWNEELSILEDSLNSTALESV